MLEYRGSEYEPYHFRYVLRLFRRVCADRYTLFSKRAGFLWVFHRLKVTQCFGLSILCRLVRRRRCRFICAFSLQVSLCINSQKE